MDEKRKIEFSENSSRIIANRNQQDSAVLWPALPYEEWKETYDTLHMWMQIVGKVKMKLNPFINNWWHIAFNFSPTGISSGLIPYKDKVFQIDFDFVTHNLFIRTSENELKAISLRPRSVANFYHEFMNSLQAIDIPIEINTLPLDVPDPVPFERETEKRFYNKEYVSRWWKIMSQLWPIFENFRSSFSGKESPVQFYSGSFDLNETRFSGKRVGVRAGAGEQTGTSESEEYFSCGFWPGDKKYKDPAFYSYISPAPEEMEFLSISPVQASYDHRLREFILPYDEVRKSESQEKLIAEFLQSTFRESTRLAGWKEER